MNDYLYHIPGLLQIKNPGLKNNTIALDNIRNEFDGIAGIDYVTTNPLSGSAVIRYYPDIIPPDRVLALLQARLRSDLHHAPSDSFRKMGHMPEYANCVGNL